jgi:hypothetical protein
MKIDKADSIAELIDLVGEKLDSTNFRTDLLEDLLRQAYSLGFRAGKEQNEDLF